ncbi:hypothetical protein QOT17_014859 [Balamuthia mandrillaris]
MIYKLFSRNPTNSLLKLEDTLTVDDVFLFHPTNKQGDVVVGDFDGDGLEEFACLYFTADNEAEVDIITVDENMQLTVTTSTTFARKPFGQMAAGHLFSPDWEELALLLGVWGAGIDESFYVHHLKLNGDGELEEGAPPLKLENSEIADTMSLDIVAGDLDGDTRDEIAFTYSYAFDDNAFHWSAYLWAAVVEPNEIIPLTAEPTDISSLLVDTSMETIGCSLAIGRFSQQQTDEQDRIFLEQIAVMGKVQIGLFRLNEETLDRMLLAQEVRRKVGQDNSDTQAYNKEFLTAVPYATENVRLGKPRHWSESTRIAIKLDNASPEGGLYPYTIYPYIFYDIDQGYLCVDYRVLIPRGASQGTISFWEEVYDKPDLTWNLPYRWDMLNGQPSNNKYFTKSLLVSNEDPEAGENLVVVFHARDYSLIPAKNVVLRFFQGDFRNPANQFGEDLLLEEVWRNGFEGITNDTWREIQEPLDRCLYAWLDPEDEILEVHENDNVGYIVLNSGSFSENELAYCGDIIKDTFGFEIPPDTTSSAASQLLPSFFL